MKLNAIEQNKFLTEILVRWVFSDSSQYYSALGIYPGDWPEEVQAGKLWREFQAHRKAKGEAFAKTKLAESLKAQEEYTLPSEDFELQELYRETLASVEARALVSELKAKPEESSTIVESFRLRKAKPVEYFCLQDSSFEILAQHEKLVHEGETILELPDWPKLSKAIGGFNKERVSLLLGKSGQGKTTLAVNLVKSMATLEPVLYVNMEMGKRDIFGKFIQGSAEMSYMQWVKGSYDHEGVQNALDALDSKKNIFVTQGEHLGLMQILGLMARLKELEEIGFVVVDYDQKITTPQGQDEWRYMLYAIQELENYAKRFNLHVMLLSQAGDEGDPKSSKRMIQSAAVQMFFHKTENDSFFLKLLKNRFGITGAEISIHFDGRLSQCSEIEFFPKGHDSGPSGPRMKGEDYFG